MERQVVGALGSIGTATLASRVLGFVRDMVVALAFGAGPVTDAFFVAFRVPNILRRLLAEGALSTAIVPVFTEYAATRGILLADTKLEWGTTPDGVLLLIDEVLTPDSSRFWPAESYRPGSSPPSFDKQYLRDWLETTTWDKNSPPPELPDEIVAKTRSKYIEAYERLTGQAFAWK